jgi:predicted CXXCH cytochrome family protein
MTSRSAKKSPKSSASRTGYHSFLILLAGVLVAGVTLTIGGFTFAAANEQRDEFCASCHTQPETSFYSRAQAGQAVDLATAHQAKQVKCIDCHSGSGLTGRVMAELLGAHNALAWYSGAAIQPAHLTGPIADENCVKCHTDIVAKQDMNNHFHVFLARWQAADQARAATCVSCHDSHSTAGDAKLKFLNREKTTIVCEACHQTLGQD